MGTLMEEGRIGRNWNEAFDFYAHVIACENDDLKIKATIKLAKTSRYAPENILALTVPILVELIQSPPSQSSPSIQEASAYCLKCIAVQGEGRLAALIGQSGAIPILLRLLPRSGGGLEKTVLKCLRNIVTFWEENRVIVANNGGVEIVLGMLNASSNDLKSILLEILSALALVREVRKLIWNSRSVHHLVEAARQGSLISRTRAAQAIGLLGLIKRARPALLDADAVRVLLHLLEEGDIPTKLVASNAIGVISSHVDFIHPVARAGVIPLYAELLQGSDLVGKEIAEDVFCVLAVHEESAVEIVEHLVRILRGGNGAAKAAAADVIWDLSSYNHISSALQNSGAIPVLVELLKEGNDELKEKVSGAVAQLSYNAADRTILASCGVIPLLVTMLEDESDELRDNAVEALANFSMDRSLGDLISCVWESPYFQNMQNRLRRIRASDAHLTMSSRR